VETRPEEGAHLGKIGYEYFYGDNGAGLGASHQTGWTGTIDRLMHFFATVKSERILEHGKRAYAETTAHVQSGQLARAAANPGNLGVPVLTEELKGFERS
jgi:hypothetical protein